MPPSSSVEKLLRSPPASLRAPGDWACSRRFSTLLVRDEHRVAVGEEAIAALHRLGIRREHALAPGKSADQHQKRRPGKVEIGEQRMDLTKLKAWLDEQRRLAGARLRRAVRLRRRSTR